MLSFHLTQCNDCTSLGKLLDAVEVKIGSLMRNRYWNIVYLSNRHWDKRLLKDLIYYRFILKNLAWNNTYYGSDFNFKDIIAKVKPLVI